jgi:Cu+-exporting ATPase
LAITLAAVGIALSLIAVGVFSRRDSPPPTRTEEAHMSLVIIPVEGMTCAACAARVKEAVASVAGVTDIKVSLVERQVRVRFDASRLAPDRIVAVINGLGYRAGTPTEAE